MMENIFSLDGIFTMGGAVANGYKIAFVKGNRDVNVKNVKSKVASIMKYGNLIPLMVIEGAKALNEGYGLVDAMTGEAIADGEKVLVILDGQHRTKAAIKAEYDLNNIRCFLSYSDASTAEQLATCNTDSNPWNGADFAHCAVTMKPNDEVAQFISKLSGKGYPLSTIGLILYRKGSVLTKGNMGKFIKGEPIKTSATPDLVLANKFIEAASTFDTKFVAKRYLIEAVVNAASTIGFLPACAKVASWTEAQRKSLTDASAAEVVDMLKALLAA